MKMVTVKNLSKKFNLVKTYNQEFPTLRDQLAHFGKKKSREEFWALKDINFSLNQGEVLGVIGQNGAGKSTLFKLISRISRPTTGEIILGGRVASLLEVGTGFHPELSGRENIFLNGAILGMKRHEIQQQFQNIITFSGVEKFIDQPVKYYSSGMYMRLAFSIAAHLTSEILIIDEVLAVGDADFQKRCLQKTQALVREEGRTVLIVSHNLDNVRQLCDKCLWLENGRLKMLGPVQKVTAAYQAQS